MNLYGQDMDDTVSPYEAALAWTVALDEGRDFIGRAALEAQKAAGAPRQMVGLVMDEKGVLRHGQKVLTAARRGRDPVRHVLADAGQGDRLRARAGRRHAAGQRRRARRHPRHAKCRCAWCKFPFVRDGQPQDGVLMSAPDTAARASLHYAATFPARPAAATGAHP